MRRRERGLGWKRIALIRRYAGGSAFHYHLEILTRYADSART